MDAVLDSQETVERETLDELLTSVRHRALLWPLHPVSF
jgi:hypothetical protein